MSEKYYNLKIIGDYLSTSLKKGKIIFNKQHLKQNEYYEPLIKNSLFRISYREHKTNEQKIKKSLWFDFDDLENTFIAKHLIKHNNELEVFEYDADNCYYETNGIIPFRWLLMVKDFYWKESTVVELDKINFNELLNEIPQIPLDEILTNSRKTKIDCRIKINSDESHLWYTLDGKFSEYTNTILKSCNSYLSLSPTAVNNYKTLYACEGGIEIFNKFVMDYVKFNHNYSYSGSVRNELKGKDSYHTGKDVNHEELLCLYLALKDKGVSVEEFKKGY